MRVTLGINAYCQRTQQKRIPVVCASQSPTHFSEDFLANVATKILLRLDEMYWDGSVNSCRRWQAVNPLAIAKSSIHSVTPASIKWVKRALIDVGYYRRDGTNANDWTDRCQSKLKSYLLSRQLKISSYTCYSLMHKVFPKHSASSHLPDR